MWTGYKHFLNHLWLQDPENRHPDLIYFFNDRYLYLCHLLFLF